MLVTKEVFLENEVSTPVSAPGDNLKWRMKAYNVDTWEVSTPRKVTTPNSNIYFERRIFWTSIKCFPTTTNGSLLIKAIKYKSSRTFTKKAHPKVLIDHLQSSKSQDLLKILFVFLG